MYLLEFVRPSHFINSSLSPSEVKTLRHGDWEGATGQDYV